MCPTPGLVGHANEPPSYVRDCPDGTCDVVVTVVDIVVGKLVVGDDVVGTTTSPLCPEGFGVAA